MKEKSSRKEADEKIEDFFREKHDQEKVRKIKNLAMSHQIKLRDLRKKFCKKCYSMNLRTRKIKNKIKSVKCEDCESLMRWKLR